MIKTIGLNDFIKAEFDFCFCCGRKDLYVEFTLKNRALYRMCPDCLEKPDVKDFIKKVQSKGVSQ